jgi:chemotaxis-related protein WspD
MNPAQLDATETRGAQPSGGGTSVDPAVANLVDDCWNRIGVQGDHSCPELTGVVHCRNCPIFAAAGAKLFDREPPADWLDEQTRHLAAPITATDSADVAMLIFRIADEWLALPISNVVEVAELRQVHSVPHRTGELFEGVVNIRGDLQLCVSLARLLGTTAARGEGQFHDRGDSGPVQRLVVMANSHARWVFEADEVAGVHRVRTADIAALPATVERSSSRITKGIFGWQDKQVGCLDGDRIFTSFNNAMWDRETPAV